MPKTERLDEHALDDLFGRMGRAGASPTPDFLARIKADALAAQPRARAMAAPAAVHVGGGAMALHPAAFDPVGGWAGLGLFVMAAITGMWIGIVGPGNSGSALSDLFGTSWSVNMLPGSDLLTVAE